MDKFPDSASPGSPVPQALEEAAQAVRSGDLQRAHQLSVKASQIDPQDPKALLLCAETAPTLEEALTYLSRLNALQPENPEAQQKTYHLLQQLLKKDPFLLYLDETDHLYHVRSGEKLSLAVPKDRSLPEAYPARRPAQLQRAFRWLWMAFLGLPLAGLGAILFTPLAAAEGIGLYFKTSSKTNRIYSLMVVLLSGGLWLIGLLLAVILLVHLV